MNYVAGLRLNLKILNNNIYQIDNGEFSYRVIK
jgi:hypothetical protein